MTEVVFNRLEQILGLDSWPLAGVVPDSLSGALIGPLKVVSYSQPSSPDESPVWESVSANLMLCGPLTVRLPGIDSVALVFGASADQVGYLLTADLTAPSLALGVPVSLEIDSSLLRPVTKNSDGTWSLDTTTEKLAVDLGMVTLSIDTEGDFGIGFGPQGTDSSHSGISFDAMIGETGVILHVHGLTWGSPDGGAGIQFTGVEVDLPDVDTGHDVAFSATNVVIDRNGFSGTIGVAPGGAASVSLLGFTADITDVTVTFLHSALTAASLSANVTVPFFDEKIALTAGLDGFGGLTVGVGAALPPLEFGPAASSGKKMFEVDVTGLRFQKPAGGTASLEIDGTIAIDVDVLAVPPIELKGLRISADGQVAIDGGWIDLGNAISGSIFGFGYDVSKIGFGTGPGTNGSVKPSRWIGINGGISLAEGLPIGVSVKGLRISWNDDIDNIDLQVSIDGIGVSLEIPGVLSFDAEVASFSDAQGDKGFQGSAKITLESLELSIDANLIIGRSPAGETFFYFELEVDLPAGIPLFNTGAAFFGFQGLIAHGMAPNRQAGQDWYWDWYRKAPIGATDVSKWGVTPGAFALGLGTTIGTVSDNGFTTSDKVLFILSLPGPVLMLNGKGKFLAQRASSGGTDEGDYDALLVLDIPQKLFQTNLAVDFNEHDLLKLSGGADIAFSWSHTPPPKVWHVYLGEDTPPERRWQAELLSIFNGYSYLMVDSQPKLDLRLGAGVSIAKSFDFGVVSAKLSASITGEADVSFDPAQISASLDLHGEIDVSVFGAALKVKADADVAVQAPKPWHVEAKLGLTVHVDLWIKSFDFSTSIDLTWGDLSLSQSPVAAISRLAHDHLLADEAGDLDNAVIPPDGRPLIVFTRPVSDPGYVGSPTTAVAPPEKIGQQQFAYQLSHVVLRKSGSLLAASGVLHVAADGSAVLEGSPDFTGIQGFVADLVRPGASGFETIESVSVTSPGAGRLALGRTAGAGSWGYRLHPAQVLTSVTVSSVAQVAADTAQVTLAANPGAPANTLGGGTLSRYSELAPTKTWPILGNDGDVVTVRATAGDQPAGTLTLLGPDPTILEGCWYPNGTTADNPAGTDTLLSIWARTPFDWLRHNVSPADATGPQPGYTCGPVPVEQPVCRHFDDLPLGQLAGAFNTEQLSATATGIVDVVSDPSEAGAVAGVSPRAIALGYRNGHGGGQGIVTFTFDPPVDTVVVTTVNDEGGSASVVSAGVAGTPVNLPHGRAKTNFAGSVSSLTVKGSAILVESVCVTPGWTCVGFDASFPHPSRGAQSYAGMTFESSDTMDVAGSTLTVTATPPVGRKEEPLARSELKLRPAPIIRVATQLTVRFPQPVTRVRVVLQEAATVTAFGGSAQVAAATSMTAGAVQLFATRGFIDSITIVAHGNLGVSEICYDGGTFGWQRMEQATWQAGQTHVVSSLSSDDPVLPPGEYELQVWAGTQIGPADGALGPVTFGAGSSMTAHFTVGDPAGFPAPLPSSSEVAVYPYGGPLTELSTYVSTTMPVAGSRPFFRAYDVGVAFRETYVTRMYLASGRTLGVVVNDANNNTLRDDESNLWGRQGPSSELSESETTYLAQFTSSSASPCVSIDVSQIEGAEDVTAGAGELLLPAQLHRAELSSGSSGSSGPGALYGFEFVTSAYAGFAHLAATFADRCGTVVHPRRRGRLDVTDVRTAESAVQAAVSACVQASAAVSSGAPSQAQFDAATAANAAVDDARAALRSTGATAFTRLAAELGYRVPTSVPTRAALTSYAWALLLETPEPLEYQRISGVAELSRVVPLRRVVFEASAFGAPDAGGFQVGEVADTLLSAMTSAELWQNGGLCPRVPDDSTPWQLDLTLPGATRVDVTLGFDQTDPSKTATLAGVGVGASAPVTGDSNVSPVTLTVTGTSLTGVTLSSIGATVQRVSAVIPFVPVLPSAPLRLVQASMRGRSIEVVAMATSAIPDITGWSVQWFDPHTPQESATLATVPHQSTGPVAVAEAGIVAFGNTAPAGAFEVPLVPGGARPPATGAVFQLVDAAGSVVSERAFLASGTKVEFVTVPSQDATRAWLVPTGRESFAAGHTMLALVHSGAPAPGLPALTIAGAPVTETVQLTFEAG